MIRCIIHVTKECEDLIEAQNFYDEIKDELHDRNSVHVNGQVTVKFDPSHPEGTPEKGPKP